MHRGRDVSFQEFEIGHGEIVGPVADLGPYHPPEVEMYPPRKLKLGMGK